MAAEKRVVFQSKWLPYVLVAPQLFITVVFFFLPATQALYQSLLVEDAFGASTQFVWFENFQHLFRDDAYLSSLRSQGFDTTERGVRAYFMPDDDTSTLYGYEAEVR